MRVTLITCAILVTVIASRYDVRNVVWASSHPIPLVVKKHCRIVSTTVNGQSKKVRVCGKRTPVPVMPIISRGVPAFASANVYPGTSPDYANDNDYSTEYRSHGLPAWVAYDLSSVPRSHRGKVLAVYYNGSYGYNTIHTRHFDNLASYTIDVNAAPGRRPPPASGWVTLVSVTGNTLHSRQQVLNLKGRNWIRIDITASDGTSLNYDASFGQFDIYDLSSVGRPTDDWIFYGDSITAGAMETYAEAGVGPFAQLIHQADPRRWPVAENGGEPFDTSHDAVHRLLGPFSAHAGTGYLSIFPGRYVVLSYGMNDAVTSSNGISYYSNMQKLVRAVLAMGKVPVIPKLNFTNDSIHNANIPALNARIDRLYKQYPQIVRGPDFWSVFLTHRALIGSNDIHPTAQGYALMRKLWAKRMLAEVYRTHPTHIPTPIVSGRLMLKDSFGGRLVNSGWGAASDGHVWTVRSGAINTLSVSNNAGHMSNQSAPAFLTLGTRRFKDAEGLVRYTTTNFKLDTCRIILRFLDENNYYSAGLSSSNNTLTLAIYKTSTTTGSVPLAARSFNATSGTQYWLRFRIKSVGKRATLSVKAWPDGTREPSNWRISYKDSKPLSPGDAGIAGFGQVGGWNIDSFAVGAL